MDYTSMSPERMARAVSVGVASVVSLYLIAALVAEPMRGFAANDTDGVVEVTVTATASSLECNDGNDDSNGDDELLTLGNVTTGGDTGTYDGTRDIHCNVISNNSAGYTLHWQVTTGSGGTSTGNMISQYEDTINQFRANNGLAVDTTAAWDGVAVGANDADWGARLSSTSDSFSEDHASRQITQSEWGSDGGTENWARVASGSSVAFASSTDETSDDGDDHYIGFRVELGSARAQPTGTYQVEVDFTTSNDT